ncbi:tyrosine-type recombinase/integrase [Qipengyuania sp. 1NDW9]|uniref:tyrosine-type recombinase/integrase n=1 Tax=Qipengyuania xiapuensis TaxID=2867236 RepID=UPI001C87630E|nr:integrase arm-type DNA-binding domain-containing protein [Qipengyuania xiapuensis]MBX7492029.1 tyrosine-type recombinase/integrase [Qipengyuania xiapuensis]
MRLTNLTIQSAEPSQRPWKLYDEGGLFLLINPGGTKSWYLKYRFLGREKKLNLGTYPSVSLKDARVERDKARLQLAEGTDPAREKRLRLAAAKLGAGNTFKIVGEEYLEKIAKEGRAAVTLRKSQWLFSLLERDLGALPIHSIQPAEVLIPLRKIEAKGNYETARRMRSLAGRIFRYAIATSRANSDPTQFLRGALITPKVEHRQAILEPRAVGALLRAIDGFKGQPLTQLALKLIPHVFVRPGELRRAEWPEFDFDRAIWTIPSTKMKMRQPHMVPLSRQSLELLREAHVLSSTQQYVFSSLYPGTRPMSENTINGALRRLGYSGEEMTAHGFRALASTLLNESGKWNPDAIERALGHQEANSVRAAYYRGQHWNERVEMAQWWSDHLDELRAS